MLSSLDSGVSAMQQFQQNMDVIGNNIANVNTTGFKGARVNFADAFSQSLGSNGAGTTLQVGNGVGTSSIANQFTQGTINPTNSPTDVAISGDGFFTVKNAASGADYVTRDGHFKVNSDGYLVNDSGFRVQGYSDSGLSTQGDIRISPPAGATAVVRNFSIGSDGVINVQLDDGTQFVGGQILLQRFVNPQALRKEGDNLYSGMTFAGALAQPQPPNTNGLGELQAGALESSNVDLASEMTSLITSQRAFQASARIITTSDEVLQEVVNLKH